MKKKKQKIFYGLVLASCVSAIIFTQSPRTFATVYDAPTLDNTKQAGITAYGSGYNLVSNPSGSINIPTYDAITKTLTDHLYDITDREVTYITTHQGFNGNTSGDDYLGKYFKDITYSSAGGAALRIENSVLGNIEADFLYNTSNNQYGAGGTSIKNSTLTSLTGDFIGNTATAQNGGAMNISSHASGKDYTIDTLTGNFINNSANTTNSSKEGYGGAVYLNNGAVINTLNANFIGNTAQKGGGIYRNSGTITNINGDFINNVATTGDGGAINNSVSAGYITNITGNFVGNIAGRDSEDTGSGGAIYNAENTTGISSIIGNFTGNQSRKSGGAIANEGKIEYIEGDFDNNHAVRDKAAGGAIYNSGGTIGTIKGNFTGNSTRGTGSTNAHGGAIRNREGAKITTIIGNFKENHGNFGGAISNEDSTIGTINGDFIGNNSIHNGGAIYNKSTISSITGDFKENYSKLSNGGGAIYNEGSNAKIHIKSTADRGVEITGNYTKAEDADAVSNAIYNSGTIYFDADEANNIVINDAITGSGGKLYINSDGGTGVVEINNSVTDNTTYLQGGTLKIGTHEYTAAESTELAGQTGIGSLSKLTTSGNSTLSTINNEIREASVGDLTMSNNLKWVFDINLSDKTTDTLSINSLSSGGKKIVIDDFNFLADSSTGKTLVTLTSASGEQGLFTLSDAIASGTVSGTYYDYIVKYSDFGNWTDGSSSGLDSDKGILQFTRIDLAYQVHSDETDKTYELNIDEEVSEDLGALHGTSLVVTGNNNKINGNSKDGIILGDDATQSLTINGVSSYNGFGTVGITNKSKGTLTISNSTFENNTTADIDNGGTLNLSGTNKFDKIIDTLESGSMNITDGTTTVGSFKQNELTVSGEATLTNNGASTIGGGTNSGTINGTGSLTNTGTFTNNGSILQAVSNSGTFTNSGSGITGDVTNTAGTFTSNAAIDGDVTVSGGTFAKNANITGYIDIGENGKVEFSDSMANLIKGTGKLNKLDDATATLTGNLGNFNGVVDIDGGTLAYDSANNNTFFGNNTSYELGDNTKLNITTGSDKSVNLQKVSGTSSAAINKYGEGTIVLSGDNSNYNGSLNIDNGKVTFDNNGTNKYINGSTAINESGTLEYSANTASTLANVSGEGTLNKLESQNLTFNETNNTFTGTANIQAGTLTVQGDKTDGFGFSSVIKGGNLSYSAKDAVSEITIGGTEAPNVSFNGSGGATFTGNGTNKTTFVLDTISGITNSNTVTINSSNIQLNKTDYTTGQYTFNNSLIDLADDSYSDIHFSTLNLTGTNNLAIDVNLGTMPDNPVSDTIQIDNGSGNFNISLSEINIHNTDKDPGTEDSYTFDVIKGNGGVKLSGAPTTWATSTYIYDVTLTSNNKGITMTHKKAADENSLKFINQLEEETRGFSLTDNDTNPYAIGSDLGDTASGTITVNGNGKTISGNNHSMFNVVNDDTNLTVKNATIENAKGTSGSVVNANNSSSNVTLDNLTIKNNSSTGNGGAINNTDSNQFTVSNSTIDNNSSGGLGGAIYTASDMTITNSDFGTTTRNTDSNGANDIYIAGASTTVTYNTTDEAHSIDSGIAGDGTLAKTGSKYLNLSGKNDNFTGTLDIQNGNVNFSQNTEDDSYTSGATKIADNSTVNLTNNLSDITAGDFSGKGDLVKDGTKDLNLSGDNSNLTGTLDVKNGNVNFSQNTEDDKYVGGNTKIAEGSTVKITNDLSDIDASDFSGKGDLVKDGTKDLNLSGDNSNLTGTLDVKNGNVNFSQNTEDDKYVSGNTQIAEESTVKITNDISDITAGNFSGDGSLIKDGEKDLKLTGDNSGLTGDVTIDNGSIVYDTDTDTKYFGGKTIINQNGQLAVKGNNDSELSKISGEGKVSKDGSGKLTFKGDNSEFVGDLDINSGTLALASGTNLGKLNNITFANDTTFNLQNTTAVKNGNKWTTDPNPSSIESLEFKTITLNGKVNLAIDVDLKNKTADNISADRVSGNGYFSINKQGLNVVSDSLLKNTKVRIANGALANNGYIKLANDARVVMGPIQKYDVNYSGGMLGFTRRDSNISDFNPSVMASVVATQIGGHLTQLETLHDGFFHMERYTKYTLKDRKIAENINKYAINDTVPYQYSSIPETSQAMWVKPYTSFEKVSLRGGINVSNITYGSLYGGDSTLYDLKNDWKGVISAFVGYNGSHQEYDCISMNQQGGTLGFTATAYKGGFFTGITVSAGGSAGEAYTQYGRDNFSMITAGIANKTGYNIEFNDGKIILQPSVFVGYTFVNTFDYTNSAGVRVDSDPLNSIQIVPGLKIIGNLKNGWQPYAGVNMVWNAIGKTHVMANDVRLPQLSVKPYVEYGVGLQKSWGDRFTAFGQAMLRNGGRNGIVLTAGFRWLFGRDSNKKTNEVVKTNSTRTRTVIKSL